jgi:hypothetical protein
MRQVSSLGRFPKIQKCPEETALAGWGARIRTWEWRNQNQAVSFYLSTAVPKKRGKCKVNVANGLAAISEQCRLLYSGVSDRLPGETEQGICKGETGKK